MSSVAASVGGADSHEPGLQGVRPGADHAGLAADTASSPPWRTYPLVGQLWVQARACGPEQVILPSSSVLEESAVQDTAFGAEGPPGDRRLTQEL
jgi:hypothetical protein